MIIKTLTYCLYELEELVEETLCLGDIVSDDVLPPSVLSAIKNPSTDREI